MAKRAKFVSNGWVPFTESSHFSHPVSISSTNSSSWINYYVYIDGYTSTSIDIPVIAGHSYNFWIHSAASNFSYADTTTYSSFVSTGFSVSAATTALAPALTPTTTTLASPTNLLSVSGTVFASSTTSVHLSWFPGFGEASYLVLSKILQVLRFATQEIRDG